MNKIEASQALKKGKILKHESFKPGEFIRQFDNGKSDTHCDQSGLMYDSMRYWYHLKNDPTFDDGWYEIHTDVDYQIKIDEILNHFRYTETVKHTFDNNTDMSKIHLIGVVNHPAVIEKIQDECRMYEIRFNFSISVHVLDIGEAFTDIKLSIVKL